MELWEFVVMCAVLVTVGGFMLKGLDAFRSISGMPKELKIHAIQVAEAHAQEEELRIKTFELMLDFQEKLDRKFGLMIRLGTHYILKFGGDLPPDLDREIEEITKQWHPR